MADMSRTIIEWFWARTPADGVEWQLPAALCLRELLYIEWASEKANLQFALGAGEVYGFERPAITHIIWYNYMIYSIENKNVAVTH